MHVKKKLDAIFPDRSVPKENLDEASMVYIPTALASANPIHEVDLRPDDFMVLLSKRNVLKMCVRSRSSDKLRQASA